MNKLAASLLSFAGILYFSNANSQPSSSTPFPAKKNLTELVSEDNEIPHYKGTKKTPLFPSEYWSVKKTINTLRELTGNEDLKKKVYVKVSAAGRHYILECIEDSIINYFIDHTLEIDKKAIKNANKDDKFSDLPCSSASYMSTVAVIEETKENRYQAQRITKK
jgi:hypothetical protein